jgi:hypothetical protein
MARTTLEAQYRNEQMQVVLYQLSLPTVWAGLEALLEAQHYPSPKLDPVDGVYRTGWSCGHVAHACDALVISIEELQNTTTRVRITRRTSQTGEDSTVIESSRAFDLEWELMRRLDTQGAQQVATAAREKADLRLANPVPWP